MRLRVNTIALVWVATLGFVVSTGCSRGPAEDVLLADIQTRLDENFEARLFEIVRLRRMGSATAPGEGDSGGGLIVYFDAELQFERDYSLTAWRGLNVGTLAFVLGATESGVTGFRPKGNQAGDVLLVHGRLRYREDDGQWVQIHDASAPPSAAVAKLREVRGSGPDAVMRSVRQLLERSPLAEANTKDAVIVREMRSAAERIDLQLAKIDGKLTFGAGPAPGTYYAFGLALSRFAQGGAVAVHSYSSEGSLENGRLLREGRVDIALVQSDVAELLYECQPAEGIFPNRDLRSLASLWPEAVHLVTLEASGIRRLEDLRGRRVAIGYRGSGTRYNAVQIAIAAGIGADRGAGMGVDEGTVPDILEVGLLDGLRALEEGDVDALFATTAIPSTALQAFAARHPDLRFVPIDQPVLDALADDHFAYYALTVAARTYPGQTQSFATLGLACALVATRQMSPETVERILGLLVDSTDELSQSNFRAAFVAPETMRLGLAVPLHRGAQRFYDERAAAAEQQGSPSDPAEAPGA
jgi:TRAP transporter TAXI family solute receptor